MEDYLKNLAETRGRLHGMRNGCHTANPYNATSTLHKKWIEGYKTAQDEKTLSRAFERGWYASRLSYSLGTNPYAYGSEYYTEWRKGYYAEHNNTHVENESIVLKNIGSHLQRLRYENNALQNQH